MAERYNVIRPTVARDFYESVGAPSWARFKIVFKKSRKGTLSPEFEGTKFFRTMADAKKALADKQKFIAASAATRAEAQAAKMDAIVHKPKKFLKKRYDFAVPGEVNIREVGYDVIEGSKNHPHTYKKIGEEIKYRVEIVEATGPKKNRQYKTVLSNADKEADTLEDAIKLRDDYRAKNPIKNPPPDLETLDEQKKKRYLDKQAKSTAIKKKGGYYSGPHTGTTKAHLGHAGNVFGIELITGDRLAYTPAEINQAMSAEGKGLDSKIRKVSEKVEKLKKQNLPPARKKKLLEQADALLVRLASQSQGFKKVTLSDGSTFGGDRLTIDMLDEFPGKTEREINEFVKNWKDEKIIT